MANFTRFQIAAAKRTAKNISLLSRKQQKLNAKIAELTEEVEKINAEIEIWETPIKASCNGMTSAEVLASLEADIENSENPSVETEVENVAVEEEVVDESEETTIEDSDLGEGPVF